MKLDHRDIIASGVILVEDAGLSRRNEMGSKPIRGADVSFGEQFRGHRGRLVEGSNPLLFMLYNKQRITPTV
jgi:hypothetical protein